jgi:SAM-dependent methyltransferase
MHAGHADHTGHGDDMQFSREFWDDRYGSADRLWSGRPNAQLVAQVSGLTPGEAMDVGSGEGADAIWLAGHGWTVTAVDVSVVALERAARQAAAEGDEIAARITWRQADAQSFEPGSECFDLVSAQYMHLPRPAQQALQRRLAAAVRPGGTLLLVGHHPDDMHANVGRPDRPDSFLSAEEMAAGLDPATWEIVLAAAIDRPATDLDGQPVTVRDSVMRALRRG